MDRNLLLCSALLDSQLSFPTHSSTYGHTHNKHTSNTHTRHTHTHTVNVAEVINNFYVFTFQVKFISRFCYGCCALWIPSSAPDSSAAAAPPTAAAFSYMTTIYDHPWAIYITAWQHSYLAWQGVCAATKYLGLKHLLLHRRTSKLNLIVRHNRNPCAPPQCFPYLLLNPSRMRAGNPFPPFIVKY